MAASQFTIYTSLDYYGPGPLYGATGSLVSILNACLVNGYGISGSSSYRPAAGWSQPLTSLTQSTSTPVVACYKQASGSGFTLFVNDNAPSTSKEVWAAGYELPLSLSGSGSQGAIYTGSNGNGFGFGQFPTAAQLLTYGHVSWRKSSTADNTTPRYWIIAADPSTFYMWIQTGDSTNNYDNFGFGDCYALKGASDLWRCFIYGRVADNVTSTVTSNDLSDQLISGPNGSVSTTLTYAFNGHYLSRNPGGTQGSVGFSRKVDSSIAGGTFQTSLVYSSPLSGQLQTPNPADNALYMSPLWLWDPVNTSLRGRFRGLYHLLHPAANFNDGQIIQGSGDFAGKTFMVIRFGITGQSAWLLETSATIDTN